ncbi:hypothetical protein DY000_02016702 [Brassica cretica]|uniref:Uncharacterized protein n=1 Tax=Brassica cretica TaxID=69181 RepID=A0ABQ7CXC1_BRACR|nr:hypothetical protein DY000_02016702 [Brassica cretica]
MAKTNRGELKSTNDSELPWMAKGSESLTRRDEKAIVRVADSDVENKDKSSSGTIANESEPGKLLGQHVAETARVPMKKRRMMVASPSPRKSCGRRGISEHRPEINHIWKLNPKNDSSGPDFSGIALLADAACNLSNDLAPAVDILPESEKSSFDLADEKGIARLDVNDENLFDVKRVVVRSGLIYTLIDSDLFHPNVVKEFIANLGAAENIGNGVAVFLRGSMVDFSPSLINALYLVPGFEEDHDYLAANIDRVCSFLTDNRVQRWEAMSSKYLTPTNQVLYKLMVYDQIINFAANINTDRSRRIIFPTLIQQVIDYQRTVLSFEDDEEYTRYLKLVVKDKKAGRGQGADSRSVDLLADIERTIADLKSIQIHLRRGEYPQYPRQTPQDEEEDEVELDSEDSESF